MILLDSFRNVPRPYTVFYTHRDSNLNPNSNSVEPMNRFAALVDTMQRVPVICLINAELRPSSPILTRTIVCEFFASLECSSVKMDGAQ